MTEPVGLMGGRNHEFFPRHGESWNPSHEAELDFERTARGPTLSRLLHEAGWAPDWGARCWRTSDDVQVTGDEALYFAVRLYYAEGGS